MSSGAPSTARLRRSPIARLRTLGFFGIVSWIVLVSLMIDIVDGHASPGVAAVGAAALIVRLAIATEYVTCDAQGLRWRSLFAAHRVGWSQVAGIETAIVRNERLPSFLAVPVATMVVVLPDGSEKQLTASIWTSIMRHAEFIAAARLISTHDWADAAAADVT